MANSRKLGYFDHITVQQQKAILLHRRGYLQEALRQVMMDTDTPLRDRQRIQWVTELQLSRLEAETAWVYAA